MLMPPILKEVHYCMEFIFNILIGIVLVIFFTLSLALGKETVTGDIFGAGGFPILLVVIGFVVLIFITKESLKNKNRVHIPLFDIKSSSGKSLIMSVVFLTAYLVLMEVIGFVISTFFFIFGSAKAMGYKRNIALVVFSLVLTVILIVVFGKVFFVPLPRGIGILKELSYFIY